MKVIKANTKKNLSIITLTCLSLLIGISVVKNVVSQRINLTYTLQDGVQTCFARLSQSYTAKLINDKLSPYLSKDFMKTTEDCFSEALSITREKMTFLSRQVEEGLNSLAEDAHWYHEKLTAESNVGLNPVPQNVILANLGTRFQKLEKNRNALVEVIDQNRQELENRNSYAQWAFVLLAPFVLIFSGLRMWKEWSGVEETEASSNELDRPTSQEIGKTIVAQQAPVPSDFIGPIVSVVSAKAEETQKKIDQMWEEFNREEKGHEQEIETTPERGVALAETFTNVMEVLSSKIFTTGFNVDFDFDENMRVLAKDEALEQIIYHIITNSINSYDFDKQNKSLSVTSKKLGGTLLLSFIDRGRGFDKSFLKALSLGEQNIDNPQYLELMICRELVKEFKGLISFENIASKDGSVLGAKVELVLRIDPSYLEETKKSKLVNLVRGKKKDVIKRMSASN